MIVADEDGSSVVMKCPLEYLARIDACLAQSATEQFLECDQGVPRVKEEDHETFVGLTREMKLQEVGHGRWPWPTS